MFLKDLKSLKDVQKRAGVLERFKIFKRSSERCFFKKKPDLSQENWCSEQKIFNKKAQNRIEDKKTVFKEDKKREQNRREHKSLLKDVQKKEEKTTKENEHKISFSREEKSLLKK